MQSVRCYRKLFSSVLKCTLGSWFGLRSHFYHKGTTTTTTLSLSEGGGLGAVVLVRAQVLTSTQTNHTKREDKPEFDSLKEPESSFFILLVTTQNLLLQLIKYSRVQDPPETSLTYCQQNKTISLYCCARTKWPLAMGQTSHSPPHTRRNGVGSLLRNTPAKILSWNQKWWALC